MHRARAHRLAETAQQQAREFVHRAERQLTERKLPFGKVPIGMMLEVPAAAVSIDVLLEESERGVASEARISFEAPLIWRKSVRPK